MTDAHAGSSPTQPARALATKRAAAVAVVIAAGSLAALETNPLVDLFLRADATLQGSFSLLNARPLLSVVAHLALVLIGLHRLVAAQAAAVATRIPARLCYGALALELLSLAPCILARDALCGVFYIFLGPITAIPILVGFAAYLRLAQSTPLVATSSLALLLAVGSALAAYWIVTPRSPAECARVGDPVKRGTCVMNFALQTSDADLCEGVDLDSSRWSCVYQIAERKGDPALCERIAPPCRERSPGPACEPESYRHTCILVVARKLRDPRLCEHMKPGDLQTRCREQTK